MVIPIPPRWFTTPKGLAYCDLVIDRGDHSDLQWVCTIFPSGQIWTFSNYEVRAAKNITLGLDEPEDLRKLQPSPVKVPVGSGSVGSS